MPSASEDFIACYFDKYVSDESARFMLGAMKWQRRFFVFSGACLCAAARACVRAWVVLASLARCAPRLGPRQRLPHACMHACPYLAAHAVHRAHAQLGAVWCGAVQCALLLRVLLLA